MAGKVIFVVVGRLGKTLTTSKLLPILASGEFDHVFVFRETAGDKLDRVTYITSHLPDAIRPNVINRALQRVFEPLQLIYYTVKLKPFIINGYQLVPKGINSFIAAKVTGTKCMISCIGGIPEIDTYFKFKTFWRSVNVFILKNSVHVTTKGKTVTDYIVNHGVTPSKVTTFNGAVDVVRFQPGDSQRRDIDLLFVGSLTELKGPDRFIKIVARLKSDYPHIFAKILGSGELLSRCEKMIDSLGLEQNIKLEGYTERTEAYYSQSKILVMPSRSEGLATAMLEAMACGCVPVVSDVGCMAEAARHERTALLVHDYLDVNAFAIQIKELLNDEMRRLRMSTACRDIVCKEYSVESQALLYKGVIIRINNNMSLSPTYPVNAKLR